MKGISRSSIESRQKYEVLLDRKWGALVSEARSEVTSRRQTDGRVTRSELMSVGALSEPPALSSIPFANPLGVAGG